MQGSLADVVAEKIYAVIPVPFKQAVDQVDVFNFGLEDAIKNQIASLIDLNIEVDFSTGLNIDIDRTDIFEFNTRYGIFPDMQNSLRTGRNNYSTNISSYVQIDSTLAFFVEFFGESTGNYAYNKIVDLIGDGYFWDEIRISPFIGKFSYSWQGEIVGGQGLDENGYYYSDNRQKETITGKMGLAVMIIWSDPSEVDSTFYARITNWDPIQIDWESNDGLEYPSVITIKDENKTVKKYKSKAGYNPCD